MSEFVVAVLAFLSMMGAALLGLFSKTRLPSEHLQDDTHSVVGLVANLFVVMTALVLGLMLNSAKNTFETNNRDGGAGLCRHALGHPPANASLSRKFDAHRLTAAIAARREIHIKDDGTAAI